MEERKIKKQVYLECKYFGKNINENIVQKVKETFSDYCDKDFGYIVKIFDNISIESNVISSTGLGAFFNIIFTALVMKPKIDSEYNGKVCMLLPNGIFVEVENRLKILIPADKMSNYKYIDGEFEEETKTKNKGKISKKKKIKKDSEVSVILTSYKYEKQNFQCIGKLVGLT